MEQWKPVEGYEGLYEVSCGGLVRRVRGYRRPCQRLLKPAVVNGYHRVDLSKNNARKSYLVHRLVLQAFVGPNPVLCCNHKNGIKDDNRVENLEWVTLADNTKHAIRNGLLLVRREHNAASKLTMEAAIEICAIFRCGDVTKASLARRFGVSPRTIGYVLRGETWPEAARIAELKGGE